MDRDGTINIDKGYVHKKEDFELLPGVQDALYRFQEAGYLLIIVTNQSGIARGYFTEKEYKEFDLFVRDSLRIQGIHINDSYYCPHLLGGSNLQYAIECNCRKPKIGLFEKAIMEHNIDPNRSIIIGDKIRDLVLCNNYPGLQGYLLYQEQECDDGNIHSITGGVYQVSDRVLKGKR